MIEEFNKNIDAEMGILKEISKYIERMESADATERKLILQAIASMQNKIKMINKSIPLILREITAVQKLPNSREKEATLEKIETEKGDSAVRVTLDKKYREKFLEELRIGEENIKKIKRHGSAQLQKKEEFKRTRPYLRIANKFFMNLSRKMVNEKYFDTLSKDLKKANMEILVEGYVSMMIFTSFLAFGFGVIIALLLILFKYNSGTGLEIYSGPLFMRAIKMAVIPIAMGIGTYLLLYLYPKTEKGDIEKNINQELPFAVVYMSAVAGSGIEPGAIFKIVALSPEYPYLRKEIRKVLNQINIYGYDLVTALTNVSRNSPSQKLAELFSGLSTTITSGGSLPDFFQKRAEGLITDYRLEREKFTRLAETSMDIYITVVIAAPMILLLIFILLSISEFAVSLSPLYLTFLIIGIIGIINVVFLAILRIKQPRY